MSRQKLTGLVATLALALVATDTPAQNRALQEQLQAVVRVDCSFPRIVQADWGDGSPEFSAEEADFEAAFVNIDVESGTADAEGRFGASYIIVRYAEGYLHFMQTFAAGPIYLTTVLAEPAEDGRLQAVHTRHEYTQVSLPGFTSRPEMYLGSCSLESAANA